MKTRTLFAVVTALMLNVSQALADEHMADGDIAAGEEIYASGCAHCHGRLGRGMGSFPRVSGKPVAYVSDRLLFGDTPVGQRIEVIDLAEDGMSVGEVIEMPLPMPPGRFRSVEQEPDGNLYAAIDEGYIYQITPN